MQGLLMALGGKESWNQGRWDWPMSPAIVWPQQYKGYETRDNIYYAVSDHVCSCMIFCSQKCWLTRKTWNDNLHNRPSVSSWWRHQMETFSTLQACERNSLVTGEFPPQKPATRSFDVFFDLRLNKLLSKLSRRRWFQTASRSLWRHCTDRVK